MMDMMVAVLGILLFVVFVWALSERARCQLLAEDRDFWHRLYRDTDEQKLRLFERLLEVDHDCPGATRS